MNTTFILLCNRGESYLIIIEWLEFLDAVIPSISDIDITRTVYYYSRRLSKLAISTSLTSPLGHKIAIGSKLLDAVIKAISYIDITRAV